MPASSPPSPLPALLLASSSPYRRALLQRLGLPFETASPDIDETPRRGEAPERYVARLAEQKATRLANDYPARLIIGTDQAAVADDDELLGKPMHHGRAVSLLGRLSGRELRFFTAVCLLRPGAPAETHVDLTRVQFRRLTVREIEAYVDAERPFDCAGGFKAEGLGIALFERIDSSDPTALIGLPLIWLAGALRRAGLPVP